MKIVKLIVVCVFLMSANLRSQEIVGSDNLIMGVGLEKDGVKYAVLLEMADSADYKEMLWVESCDEIKEDCAKRGPASWVKRVHIARNGVEIQPTATEKRDILAVISTTELPHSQAIIGRYWDEDLGIFRPKCSFSAACGYALLGFDLEDRKSIYKDVIKDLIVGIPNPGNREVVQLSDETGELVFADAIPDSYLSAMTKVADAIDEANENIDLINTLVSMAEKGVQIPNNLPYLQEHHQKLLANSLGLVSGALTATQLTLSFSKQFLIHQYLATYGGVLESIAELKNAYHFVKANQLPNIDPALLNALNELEEEVLESANSTYQLLLQAAMSTVDENAETLAGILKDIAMSEASQTRIVYVAQLFSKKTQSALKSSTKSFMKTAGTIADPLVTGLFMIRDSDQLWREIFLSAHLNRLLNSYWSNNREFDRFVFDEEENGYHVFDADIIARKRNTVKLLEGTAIQFYDGILSAVDPDWWGVTTSIASSVLAGAVEGTALTPLPYFGSAISFGKAAGQFLSCAVASDECAKAKQDVDSIRLGTYRSSIALNDWAILLYQIELGISFSINSGILTIPVVDIPNHGVFEVKLQFNEGSQPPTFTLLDIISSQNASIANKARFSVETNQLYLPSLEALLPKKSMLYDVEMKMLPETNQFVMTRIGPFNLAAGTPSSTNTPSQPSLGLENGEHSENVIHPLQIKMGEIFRDKLKDGSEGPEMIWIPGGTFRMGDIQGEGELDEQPVHKVSVDSFAMSRYEVTFDEYEKFTEATGKAKPNDEGWGRGKHPVINVSWEEAVAYAEWVSQQTGHTYRLPTEAQWEYATRTGTTTKYWWGNDISSSRANCNNCSSWRHDKTPAPVGSFVPNNFGLYDTAGNVKEWTCSAYESSYKGAEQRCIGDADSHVVQRGGSWLELAQEISSASRFKGVPSIRYSSVGIRLVLSEGITLPQMSSVRQPEPRALNAPTDLTAFVEDGKITLSWNPVKGATYYNIYWQKESGEEQVIKSTSAFYIHTGLNNGKTYTYRVTAFNVTEGVESPLSEKYSATPSVVFSCDTDKVVAGEHFDLIEYESSETGLAGDIYNHVLMKGGSLDLASGQTLTIHGHFIQSGGTVQINEGQLVVKGSYCIQTPQENGSYSYSSGNIIMQNETDYVLVNGDFVMDNYESNYYKNILTAGTLEIKGNFTQKSTYGSSASERNFFASGTHKVKLSGNLVQTVSFEDSSYYSRLNSLEITNSSNQATVFTSPITVGALLTHGNALGQMTLSANSLILQENQVIEGDLKLNGQLDLNGKTLTVNGSLLQTDGELKINGGELIISGNLTQTRGHLIIGGGNLKVGSDYRLQRLQEDGSYSYSSAYLIMQNDTDYVLVNGEFVMDSSNYRSKNVLTAGTLEIKGNFTQKSTYASSASERNFSASGTHKVILSTSSSVSFEDEDASHFNDVKISIPESVQSAIVEIFD